MRRKNLIPIVITAVTVSLLTIIMTTSPSVKKRASAKANKIMVETVKITEAPYQIQIESYGVVAPEVSSSLTAQVDGEIMITNPQFKKGGQFQQGDVLILLDDRDYIADLKIAQADLMSAKLSLSEEKAKSAQAKEDWDNLNHEGKPSDLTLRIPQLEAAKANVLKAEAAVLKADLAIERSEIIAPYSGRILNKNVDLGQYISRGTNIADIFANDYSEVRLPIQNKDLKFLNLPTEDSDKSLLNVTLESDLYPNQKWQANLNRTESAIDEATQQLYVVAQIDNSTKSKKPIISGQYVTAKFTGKVVERAIIIPNDSIYQGSYVYVEDAGILKKRSINIAWKNSKISLISSGLRNNDNLITTTLGLVTSGTAVKVINTSKGAE